MDKSVKTILLIVGVVLIGYGIYTLITPETSVNVDGMSVVSQDIKDSYITMGLGLVAIVLSFLGGRKA